MNEDSLNASRYWNLSIERYDAGDLDSSRIYAAWATPLYESYGDYTMMVEAINTQGNHTISMASQQKGFTLYDSAWRTAQKYLTPSDPSYRLSLSNQAYKLFSMGESEKAARIYQDLISSEYQPDSRDEKIYYANILYSLGSYNYDQRDFSNSLIYLKEALRYFDKAGIQEKYLISVFQLIGLSFIQSSYPDSASVFMS